MENHTFDEVSRCIRRDINDGYMLVSGILVKPPVTGSPTFTRVVLGAEAVGVTLNEIMTTPEYAMFGVECYRPDLEENVVNDIGMRICALANEPHLIAQLTRQKPFAAV